MLCTWWAHRSCLINEGRGSPSHRAVCSLLWLYMALAVRAVVSEYFQQSLISVGPRLTCCRVLSLPASHWPWGHRLTSPRQRADSWHPKGRLLGLCATVASGFEEWWTVAQHLCAGRFGLAGVVGTAVSCPCGWQLWSSLPGRAGGAFPRQEQAGAVPTSCRGTGSCPPGGVRALRRATSCCGQRGPGSVDQLQGLASAGPGLQQSSPAAYLAKLFASWSLAFLICEMGTIVTDLAHGVLGGFKEMTGFVQGLHG